MIISQKEKDGQNKWKISRELHNLESYSRNMNKV